MTTATAITPSGELNSPVRIDYINQVGPVDAWVTLDTVTLTNSPQLFFDTSSHGKPPRLYRLVPKPEGASPLIPTAKRPATLQAPPC
jgi:hypothetical protein